MSEKYYYVEPYLKTIDAKITGITNKGLILDRTISYPEGGGQPGDRGTINGIKYTDTIHDNDEIVHVIANAHIYDRHLGVARELLNRRESFEAPKVEVEDFVDFYLATPRSVVLKDYKYSDYAPKFEVAV